MPTARDLISRSLKSIGALSQGEAIQAADAADALSALNGMLGTWSTERLLVYAIVRETFTLVPSTASYTIGASAATFTTTRPQRIENASILIDGIETAMEVITKDQYAELINKTVESEMPAYLYPEGTFPNETIKLYPVPSVAYILVLYSWKPFSSLALIDDAVDLPPGYDEAIIYNLAMRLAPEYGKPISAEVAELARMAKANVKRMNSKPTLLKSDRVESATLGDQYRIFSGG